MPRTSSPSATVPFQEGKTFTQAAKHSTVNNLIVSRVVMKTFEDLLSTVKLMNIEVDVTEWITISAQSKTKWAAMSGDLG